MGLALGNYGRLFANRGARQPKGAVANKDPISREDIKIAVGKNSKGEKGNGKLEQGARKQASTKQKQISSCFRESYPNKIVGELITIDIGIGQNMGPIFQIYILIIPIRSSGRGI